MSNTYKPNLSQLNEKEKEIADRLIVGSNHLYKKFVDALRLDPLDFENAKNALLENKQSKRAGKTFHNKPIDLRHGQTPRVIGMGCIDARVDVRLLLAVKELGDVFVRREPACDVEVNGKISKLAARSIVIALSKGVDVVALFPHGRCSAIDESAHFIHQSKPQDAESELLWDMAQEKSGVFKELEGKGVEYYISRLDEHDQYKDDHDRYLQAVEICAARRDLQVVREFVSSLNGGDNITVVSVYMDIRTLNPHLLIAGKDADDWRFLRLTDHPEIPHAQSVINGLTHTTHEHNASCHRPQNGGNKAKAEGFGYK